MPELIFRSRIEAAADAVWRWHTRPGALERLLPPWDRVAVERRARVENGERAVLLLRRAGVRFRWVAEHRDVRPGVSFKDVQVSGPFSRFEHTHAFLPDGDGTVLEDAIRFELPFGWLGAFLAEPFVRRDLVRTFRFRHRRTADDLHRAQPVAERGALRVAVTGATGLIGTALTAFLSAAGHEVRRVTRRPESPGDIGWNPEAGSLDAAALEGVDAVVHLAGENIATGRWTTTRKARIRGSRVDGTRLLSGALAGLAHRPRVLVSASGIDYYGASEEATFTEASPRGVGFLADVCEAWEGAAEPARRAGIRVVSLRTGPVVAAAGGLLRRVLLPYRLGLGGPVGGGGQWMSWIGLDDLVGVIHHVLFAEDLEGPVNATSPQPVDSRTFARTLGRVLRRPARLPLPAAAVRLLFGEMGQELLLAGARVLPERLLDSGFVFLRPGLDDALREELGLLAGTTGAARTASSRTFTR